MLVAQRTLKRAEPDFYCKVMKTGENIKKQHNNESFLSSLFEVILQF